ncbi:hypothetical protein [Nocardia abscessus]|uniref:Secreted protein n=1 Tax=Nocardia abscessus TaxID=120957 RepID=A0ABS0C5I9_9NOCA|nr:hypothetical protein [Nocardia abscessus]MBF6225646.1 hypothetical protein [Nocardia abscessus]MCC3326983.1 hypothetical protein [Nocardia abscessus]
MITKLIGGAALALSLAFGAAGTASADIETWLAIYVDGRSHQFASKGECENFGRANVGKFAGEFREWSCNYLPHFNKYELQGHRR